VDELKIVAINNGSYCEALKVTVRLTTLEDHMYADGYGNIRIKAKGYLKLNQFAKISIIKPDTLVYGNYGTVGNPYKHYGTDGELLNMVIKAYGIGYVVGGGIVMVQHTAAYDSNTILTSKMLDCIKDYPSCGFITSGPEIMPEVIEYSVGTRIIKIGTSGIDWKYHPMGGSLGGIMYNVRSEEINRLLREHWESQRNIDSIMNTLVTKQILRQHPAIGVDTVGKIKERTAENGVKYLEGYVDLYMWKRNLTKERILELENSINSGTVQLVAYDDGQNTDGELKEIRHTEGSTLLHDDEEMTSNHAVVEIPINIIEDTDEEREKLLSIIRSHPEMFLCADISKPVYEMNTQELTNIIKEKGVRMEKIKEIYIDNLKNLKGRSFGLGTHTLIVGENGSGKTGIMEAVSLLATGSDPKLSKPGAKSPLSAITGLIPDDEKTMTIRGEYESGKLIERIYTKKGDKNSQTININGSPRKTGDAEKEIEEWFGDFMISFNTESFIAKSDKERRDDLFDRFGHKLKKLDDSVGTMCMLAILSESEEYNGIMKYVYGASDVSELDAKKIDEFKEAVKNKLPGVIHKHIVNIENDILPKISKENIQIFINDFAAAVRAYKNETDRTLTIKKASLEEDRMQLTDGERPADIEPKIEEVESQLTELNKHNVRYNSYLKELSAYEAAQTAIAEIEESYNIEAAREKAESIKKEIEKSDFTAKKASDARSELLAAKGLKINLDDIKDQYTALSIWQRRAESYRQELEHKERAIKELKDKLASDMKNMKKMEKAAEQKKVELEDIYNVGIDQKKRRDILMNRISENERILGLFKSGKCPTCHTDIKDVAIDIDGISKTIAADKKSLVPLNKEIDEIDKKSMTLQNEYEVKMKAVRDMEISINQQSAEKGYLESAVSEVSEKMIIDDTESKREYLSKLAESTIVNYGMLLSKYHKVPKEGSIIDKVNGCLDNTIMVIEDIEDKLTAYDDLNERYITINVEIEKIQQRKAEAKKAAESIKKPEVVPYDKHYEDKHQSLTDKHKELKLELAESYKREGIIRKIAEAEEKLAFEDSGVKYLRKGADALDAYKIKLVDELLQPVETRAKAIYSKVYDGELVFGFERSGVVVDGKYIPLKYLSGGQQTVFLAGMLGGIMEASNAKTKSMAIETGEIDDDSFNKFLEALRLIDADNILVATYPRHDINTEGWEVIRL
jgi:DNA repair exonuclease SbcCD ATPase subunit